MVSKRNGVSQDLGADIPLSATGVSRQFDAEQPNFRLAHATRPQGKGMATYARAIDAHLSIFSSSGVCRFM